MSEFDSLSDSDWQEVSSGRYSDDNDSLSEPDSDRDEINSMPRSRRSSISNADSLSSDVDCWQGLVSDSGDDGTYTVPHASPLGAEPVAVGINPDLNEAVDPVVAEEDQRVREALDQSFVGTLSSSRSSNVAAHTTSVHNSIRDLRLSFPDPLTSSRDELNRSYEAIYSPTETTISTSTDDDANDSEVVPPIIAAPLVEDPGTLSITPEIQHHEVQHLEFTQKPELQIVLYGSSSECKWEFILELIKKAAGMSGHILTQTRQEGEKTQFVHLMRDSEEYVPFFNNIKIDDCTAGGLTMTEVDYSLEREEHPSLAIVYLPTAKLPVLSLHNAYLPVLTPSTTNQGDSFLQDAEDDWELLGVPESRTLKLGANKSPVFDAQELSCINPTHAYKVLRGIDRNIKRITGIRPLTEQVKSVNAVTLFALMSIIMGFAFNTAFRPAPPSPTPTTNTPSSTNGDVWGIFAIQPNRSILASPSAKGDNNDNNNIGVSPSLKDMAISVFSAGSTSLSLTSSSSSAVSLSKGVTTHCQDCGGSSKSGATDKPRAATDIVVRSTATSLASVPHLKPSGSITASGPDKQPETTILLGGAERTPKSTVGVTASAASSLSFNSVSEMFDATTKALAEAMGSDLAEFVEAADELLLNMREQTDSVSRQWKGKARAIGEQLQNLNEEVVSRHERAKTNARAFGKKAGEIVRGATEELRAGTGRAQKKARKQMQSIVEGGAEAWKNYERAQEEWEGVLSGKANVRGEERKSEKGREKYDKENDRHQGRACLKGTKLRRLRRNKLKGGHVWNDL